MFNFVDYQAAEARRKEMLEKSRQRQLVHELLDTPQERTTALQSLTAYAAQLRQVITQVIQRPAPVQQTSNSLPSETIVCVTC